MRRPFLLAALLPLFAACGHDEPAPHEEIRPVYSTVAGASRGSVGASWSGTVQARYESKLGFEAGGRVAARLVDVGARVKRGQLLMRLDPAQEQLQVASASAEVDGAKTRVAQLRNELQRTEQLHARSFASQAELDQQRSALAEAEAQLRSAASRQQIQVNKRGYTELAADRDGVVTAINAERGQVVSAGQPVVTVAADGEREVLVSVAESRVDELRLAKTLQVTLWAQPGKAYPARLRELAPDADAVSRTYAARIAVQGDGAPLMLGMTASVSAPDIDSNRAIRLPLTAVRDRDGQTMVWIVDPASQQVAERRVQLGAAESDLVQIVAGLAGGETVVTAGVHSLHPGQKVKTIAAPAIAGAL